MVAAGAAILGSLTPGQPWGRRELQELPPQGGFPLPRATVSAPPYSAARDWGGVVQEAAYCGPGTASAWSAQRVLSEAPFRDAFDYRAALADGLPVLFTGEMALPWLTEDFRGLRALAPLAELLAAKADWPALYDLRALRNTRVPVAAVVDAEDIYMDLTLTRAAAAHLGPRCGVWVCEGFSSAGLSEVTLDALLRVVGGEKPPAPPRLPPGSDPGRPLSQRQLEDLELREAEDLLQPCQDWRRAYREFRQRVRDGLDEELLMGGVISAGHYVGVPLDHGEPEGRSILVFFREVVLAAHAAARESLPVLLFLTGGPGFAAPKPNGAETSGWLSRALRDHRVLLLDQRGTGRSAPITAQSLRALSAAEQAAHLARFRADSIVEDCEAVRRALRVPALSLLGESFGGFCALTYLSRFPGSLRAVYFTGGLAPVLASGPDEVYRHTYRRVVARNERYYARYPGDVAKAQSGQQRGLV